MSEIKLSWQDPTWLKQVHTWIHNEASKHSIQITGEIEQPHIYPWSTVLRVPTNASNLFFKATASETVYEIALTQKLAELSKLFARADCNRYNSRLDVDARRWRLASSSARQKISLHGSQ
ncbi:MAG: hypothetical protein U0Z26_02140 [Anaerolineales bacterium]